MTTTAPPLRWGGPCPRCGRAQITCAIEGCDRPRSECGYGTGPEPVKALRLANMIRIYVAASGLRQKDIAAEIGVNESTLSRFLNCEGAPDAAGFAAILRWCLQPEIAA